MTRIPRILLAALVLLAPVPAAVLAATPADTVVMGKQIDDIVSLDPAESYEISGAEILGNVYERLVEYDATSSNKLAPGLAQSWDVSADDLTFTFHLRPDAKFHSGHPVTSADVIYSLTRAVKIDKAQAVVLNAIGLTKDNVEKSVLAADDHTVTIKLPRALAPSFVYFCLTATVGSIVDHQLVAGHEQDKDLGNQWLATQSAGSGPYRLVMWRPGEYYSLEANPNYGGPAPKTKRVIVRDVKEPATQRLMLERGDIDYARDLEKDQLDAISKNPDIHLDKGVQSDIAYLGLNQKNEYLKKPEVIEALKYLIDYRVIANAILGGTRIVHQSFEPLGFLGEVDDQPYGLDIDKAKALLAKAGLAQGFSVTMDIRNSSPWTDIGQALQANFAQAGIKLELIPGDGKQILTKYRARHHDIYLGDWEPDYPDPHSNAEAFIVNPSNADDSTVRTPAWRNAWQDKAISAEVEAALVERDDTKRAELYRNLQMEHRKTAPFVMMFERVEIAAHRAAVDGFKIGVTAQHDRYAGIVKH